MLIILKQNRLCEIIEVIVKNCEKDGRSGQVEVSKEAEQRRALRLLLSNSRAERQCLSSRAYFECFSDLEVQPYYMIFDRV